MGPLARFVLKEPVLWLMQSEHDRKRLIDAGVDGNRIRVTGNIKFDRERRPMESRERRTVASALGISASDGPVWVAGSTHPGEEDVLLEVFARLRRRFSSLRLVLAPRRVERAHEVQGKAEDLHLSVALRSGPDAEKTRSSVVVLDTLGELERVYGLAFVSFVGGSLVSIGGHNLLEPAGFGRPVLFGPHMHNFQELSERLLEAGGGVCVRDGQELERVVIQLLGNPEEADRMGERARAFVESNRGAVERVWTQLNRVVPLGPPEAL
jgi:3-deoxy-D-manno-octulosonic-acid transferase